MNDTPRLPERNKRPGLCYALTDDGIELPVIDVTHPAFALSLTQAELDAVTARTLEGFERGKHWPAFLLRLMARRSVIMRNVLRASGSYLTGMATYLEKLGPDNVGTAWGSRLDRKLLRTVGPVCMRLRLQDEAALLAEALVERLAGDPTRAVHVLNIGGGTAIDSLNALILAERQHAGLLLERSIVIHVLDPDREGPSFGTRALAALSAPGGPLENVRASLERHDYDWRNPGSLADVIGMAGPGAPFVACCSEGALFEYGCDADVAANLSALRNLTPADTVIVGTVLLDRTVGRAMVKYGGVALRLREAESFAALAASTGWRVAGAIEEGGVYYVVRLAKGPRSPLALKTED